MPEIESRLANALRALVPDDAPLVVGVSGGADSTALLHLLHAARGPDRRVVVAHLHHGVRGAEADADAAFVADLAASLDRPFVLGHWQPTRSGHFESDARQARFTFLADVARQHDARHVAVAHTTDDQAETVVHRIVRGTGPRGLAGMPVSRRLGDGVTLIRPLLAAGLSRHDVLATLDHLGQTHRTDATNNDPGASTRARIRHVLLPLLRTDFNPHASEALVRLADLVRLQNQALAPVLDAAEAQVVGPDGRLDRRALADLPTPLAVELLRWLWSRRGWPERSMTADRWQRLADLARAGPVGRHAIGSGVVLHNLGPDRAEIERPEASGTPRPAEPSQPLPVPGCAAWGDLRIVAEVGPSTAGRVVATERIDLDRVVLPLVVRGPQAGDRFAPLGLNGHTQPLADFLRARRVPCPDRPRVALVCDQAGIVWVVSHRIADRVRVSAQTRQVLHLRAEGGRCD
jgi:tRNA(Ile)-lysidine synthase